MYASNGKSINTLTSDRCVLKERKESGEGKLAKFVGFYSNDPGREVEWKATDLETCVTREGSPEQEKLKHDLEILACLNGITTGDPADPLFVHPVSSFDVNMATTSMRDRVKECFDRDGMKTMAVRTFYNGNRCAGLFDPKFQENQDEARDTCNDIGKIIAPSRGLLESIDKHAERFMEDGASFLHSKLFDIGTSFGSRLNLSTKTQIAGD